MIIAVFILLSIPVGYVLGGKIKNVKNYTTRALGLPIGAFLLEAVTPLIRNLVSSPVSDWHWIIVLAEYMMLFLFCVLNRNTKAVWLIFLACLLNFVVIAINGFQMPVTPAVREMSQMAEIVTRIESGEYFRYTIAEYSDPLWFLGDVILIPIKGVGGFASVGDLLLGVGCGWLFCDWMLTRKQAEAAPARPADYQPRH